MPTITTDPGLDVTTFPGQKVRVSDTLLDGNWSDLPFVWCDKLTLAANAYDQASLRHHLGDVIQPGDSTFDRYQPLDLVGKYVQVNIGPDPFHPEITWIGYVVSSSYERAGVKPGAPAAWVSRHPKRAFSKPLYTLFDKRPNVCFGL